MPLQAGTTLGPYQIDSPLGAGGMGEVYKVTDTRLDRTVAIKVLPEHVANDPDLKQRFEREARTVAALNSSGCPCCSDTLLKKDVRPRDLPSSLSAVNRPTLSVRRRFACPLT